MFFAPNIRTLYSEALRTKQIPSSASFDETQERIAYEFRHALPAGSKAELEMVFGGKLTGSMVGYYKSAWEHEGTTKYYALTQFEVRILHIIL